MRLPLSGLTAGPHTIQKRLSAVEYLRRPDIFTGDLSVQATLSREVNLLRVELEAELSGNFCCDRCGEPFSREHHCREVFHFAFQEGKAFASKVVAQKLEEQGVRTIPREANELDVTQEIRDLVLLSLPYQTLCQLDCQGLCPRCGANLNRESCSCIAETGDPRWEILKRLKTED